MSGVKKQNADGPHILIVGAGAAGIAAASKLLQKNFQVTILEAGNRIGGRIYSVYLGESYVDLGAEWCHGQTDNIVYKLVKDYDILRPIILPKKVYLSNRESIDDELIDDIFNIVKSIDFNQDSKNITSNSLGQVYTKLYQQLSYNKYFTNPSKLKLASIFEELFHHMILSAEGAFTWNDLAVKNDFRECEGDFNLSWGPYGYKTVLDVLMKTFPDASNQIPVLQNVQLKKEVGKIYWQERGHRGFKIECTDHTTYYGDHIIFTASVGVLKETCENMFVPPLPPEKHRAISEIGFDSIMKIPMYYETPWWDLKDFNGFNLVWTKEDQVDVVREFAEGPKKDGKSWLTDIFSFMPVQNNPHVISCYITGETIPELERTADKTVIDGLTFVLVKFLGHLYNNIEKPTKIVRYSWYTNRHFRGAFSYQKADISKKGQSAQEILAEPLFDNNKGLSVLFAGEATHPHYFSTVHGAIESGFREADRILNLYNIQNNCQ